MGKLQKRCSKMYIWDFHRMKCICTALNSIIRKILVVQMISLQHNLAYYFLELSTIILIHTWVHKIRIPLQNGLNKIWSLFILNLLKQKMLQSFNNFQIVWYCLDLKMIKTLNLCRYSKMQQRNIKENNFCLDMQELKINFN